MDTQLCLPCIPSPTLAELARCAQEKIGLMFARAFRRRHHHDESTQLDLLDPARIASEFARTHADEIAKFEQRYGQPCGGLVGAVWADIVGRWRACKPLRLITILRHALAKVAGPLIKRAGKKGDARLRIGSLTDDDGSQRDVDDDAGLTPLDALLRAGEGALDAADAWLAEHEPQRTHKGVSKRTQERERAEERALREAMARSAAHFAASAGRVGCVGVTP